MNLFRSRLAKVEALVSTKAEDRTPEQLEAAQTELGDFILVPKSDNIKSAADLQNHIDRLEGDAREAKAAAETAQKALTDLKGQRVLPSQKATSDKGEGGDGNMDEASKEFKNALEVAHEKPYTARVLKMQEQN